MKVEECGPVHTSTVVRSTLRPSEQGVSGMQTPGVPGRLRWVDTDPEQSTFSEGVLFQPWGYTHGHGTLLQQEGSFNKAGGKIAMMALSGLALRYPHSTGTGRDGTGRARDKKYRSQRMARGSHHDVLVVFLSGCSASRFLVRL